MNCPECKGDNIIIEKGEGHNINGLDFIAIICNDCKKVYGLMMLIINLIVLKNYKEFKSLLKQALFACKYFRNLNFMLKYLLIIEDFN